MLSRILAALAALAAPAPAPLAVAQIYRGCATGWQTLGGPRPRPQADRLAALSARIRPAGHHRVRPV